ncbi:MAG: STAS domain-containing protein [Candidatus Latescibacterota bacterium]|nr:MAG: STAS domain-containing protein [Candidatus Latescibacterota bacterium]
MRVHIERHPHAVVVQPEGRFYGGRETKELETKIGALVSEGHACLIVDLARTQHLNSVAIGVLVGAHIRAERRGTEVRVCNADQGIHHTLIVLKLVNEMHVFDTLQQAIAAPRRRTPPLGHPATAAHPLAQHAGERAL